MDRVLIIILISLSDCYLFCFSDASCAFSCLPQIPCAVWSYGLVSWMKLFSVLSYSVHFFSFVAFIMATMYVLQGFFSNILFEMQAL